VEAHKYLLPSHRRRLRDGTTRGFNHRYIAKALFPQKPASLPGPS
jgi:hypothetical protein